MTNAPPVAVALVMWVALVGCSGDDGSRTADGNGDAACAAVLEIDGDRYVGHGELERDPEVTGRTVRGILPSCDDTGGQDAPEPPEPAAAAELEDVLVETAVLLGGTVYLREGVEMPPEMRAWFEAPVCDTEGSFELTGTWSGVTGLHEPELDGDIRPPYRLEVHVTDGPEPYRGSTIDVHATERTDPALGPEDVKTSLWKGGEVIAQVRCDGDRFVASALRSAPPAS